MRKLFLASLIGATVALGTGCDGLNKLLTPVTPTKTGTNTPTNTAQDAQKAQEMLQAQLQQAAGFSANLQQAAGFGAILNGPTGQLQQAAGIGSGGAAMGFRIQSAPTWTNGELSGELKGEFGSGDLVASGSITGTDPSTTSDGKKIYQTFQFDLEVATASKIPSLLGAKVSGNLSLDTNVTTPGLSGTMTFVKDNASNDVKFAYTVGQSGPKWILTGPVMINAIQHWTHLEVNADHTGTGWVATDEAGSTDKRVAYCESKNGKWAVTLIQNSAATSSIDMPWSSN